MCLCGGGVATVEGFEGNYVKPALLAGSLDNVAAREEIFGPVAYVTTFETEDEAIAMANDTDYGLANSVWTSDKDRANRVAESMVAGNSWINAHNVFAQGVPYRGECDRRRLFRPILTHTFAGFLSTVCCLAAVALASYCLLRAIHLVS